MSLDIRDLIPAFEEYNAEVQNWVAENNLVVLPPFRDLHNKDIWGVCYREDQIYYEAIADFKNKLFAVKSAALALLTEKYNSIKERESKNLTDRLIVKVDNDIEALDNLLYKARARLKFYETVTYVVGNVTYGAH